MAFIIQPGSVKHVKFLYVSWNSIAFEVTSINKEEVSALKIPRVRVCQKEVDPKGLYNLKRKRIEEEERMVEFLT